MLATKKRVDAKENQDNSYCTAFVSACLLSLLCFTLYHYLTTESCAAVPLASLCAVSAALSYVLHCHRPDHTSILHHCTLYSGYITSHLGFLDTF